MRGACFGALFVRLSKCACSLRFFQARDPAVLLESVTFVRNYARSGEEYVASVGEAGVAALCALLKPHAAANPGLFTAILKALVPLSAVPANQVTCSHTRVFCLPH